MWILHQTNQCMMHFNPQWRHWSLMNFSVASCITKITRITTPDTSYDDEQMKEIFQLIVATFENLSICLMCSIVTIRRRLQILTLMQRSDHAWWCWTLSVMHWLLFQIFFKIIRSIYSLVVFLAMETIMSLDIYKEITLNLLRPLLVSVRKEIQKVYPIL